jgi:hypothetical protein
LVTAGMCGGLRADLRAIGRLALRVPDHYVLFLSCENERVFLEAARSEEVLGGLSNDYAPNLRGCRSGYRRSRHGLFHYEAREITTMPAILYRCPVKKLPVSSWVAHAPQDDDRLEAIECIACKRIHMVNPKTGKVVGDGD